MVLDRRIVIVLVAAAVGLFLLITVLFIQSQESQEPTISEPAANSSDSRYSVDELREIERTVSASDPDDSRYSDEELSDILEQTISSQSEESRYSIEDQGQILLQIESPSR